MAIHFHQKTIARLLDDAADRTAVGDEPATRKQCWYLAALIAQHRDYDAWRQITANAAWGLTKRAASLWIGEYRN